jgi:hypothetical protein
MFYTLLRLGPRTKKKKKDAIKAKGAAAEDLSTVDQTPSKAHTPLRPGKIYPMPTPLRDLVSLSCPLAPILTLAIIPLITEHSTEGDGCATRGSVQLTRKAEEGCAEQAIQECLYRLQVISYVRCEGLIRASTSLALSSIVQLSSAWNKLRGLKRMDSVMSSLY